MKLYAYVDPRDFKAYLAEKQTVETEESLSSFLHERGTTGILVDRVKVGYVEVSPGSCVRVHSETSVKPSEVAPIAPIAPVAPVAIPPTVPLDLHSQSFWSRKWSCCF